MKDRTVISKAYISMLFWDIAASLFDGKYKEYRRQSKRVVSLLKATIKINRMRRKGYKASL